jgi:WD40 repeat protein
MPTLLRIFISSPGDVIPERRRAQLVIEKLAKKYNRFFTIEAVLWEVEPMLASGHFQDQIIPPSETDTLLLIVWSRLGTPLPSQTETRQYRGIDGRTPVTGTEWEFEDALAAQKRRGAPDVLAYRKQTDPTVSLRDTAAKAAAEEQWDKLNLFWNRWFVNKGQFIAAFSEFDDLDGFESKLEADLQILIDRRIQAHFSGGQQASGPTWLVGSPFRGLEVYRIEHAPIFFGRSAMTKAAVEQLTRVAENGRAFILILGASGAGKSSLAQAGVLPALTTRGVVPRVGHWRHAVIRPGGHPDGSFAALAEALVSKAALPELLAHNQECSALARHLQASADDPSFPIISVLNQIEIRMRQHGELLEIEYACLAIVVDQLEELFTIHDLAASDRAAFIRCLDGLAKSGRIFVVATMRSDYWHRAAETPQLVDMAAGPGRIDLLAPAEDEIIEMIRQPAEAAGLEFEADPVRNVNLDATLAIEAEASPAAMPLLSFLLDEIYKRDVRDRGRSALTFESMHQLGGLRGAIANRAEAALLALPAEVQATLPRVLRTLVTVSRSGAAATARAAPMSLFGESGDEYRLVQALLDPQVRLLVAEGDGLGARVRLAHEALITHWDRAKRQIEQDRDDLRTRAVVEEALAEWRNASPRDKHTYLLRDPQLANAIDLAKRWNRELDGETAGFIQSSQRRARFMYQLTMASAAVFAIVAVVAVGATYLGHQARLLAETQKGRAEKSEAKALTTQSRSLADLSNKLSEQRQGAALALLLEALPDPKRGNERPIVFEAERGLFGLVQTLRERAVLRGHTWTITNVAFSPDGRSLLTSSWDHKVRVWDVANWKERLVLDDNAGAITVATFSPDGRFILAAPNDGTARVFDAATGAVVNRLAGARDELTYGSYSPDGERILLAAGDKSPRLWNAKTGTLVAVLAGHEDNVSFGGFSPDGSLLITVSADSLIRAWSGSDGKFSYQITGHHDAINSAEFSPDGRYLVTAAGDGVLRIWEAKTGKFVRSMAGPAGDARQLAFSPDGSRVAAAYSDKIARVWQIASGQQISEMKGHDSNIWSIVFSPDGKLIATTSPDKTARLWDAKTGVAVAVFRGHNSAVRRAAFSPDGQWLATISGQGTNLFDLDPDNTARIWNVKSSLEIGAVRENNRILSSTKVSPDGHLVIIQDSAAWDAKFSASARLWDADTHEELRDLRIDASVVNALASGDGSRIATTDQAGIVRMWDVTTASRMTAFDSGESGTPALAFSPDGTLFATAQGHEASGKRKREIKIVRSSDGSPIKTLVADISEINKIVFSSDNKWLAAFSTSFSSDGIRVWSLTSGMAPVSIAEGREISEAVFAEGGATILTMDNKGHVESWMSETGEQIADWVPPNEYAAGSVIGPEGLSIVTDYVVAPSSTDRILRIIYRGSEHRLSIPEDENECSGAIVFSPDGKRFLTYGNNELLCLRDARDGRLVAKVACKSGSVTAAKLSRNGDLIALGAEDGTAIVWTVGSSEKPRRFQGHRGKITDLAFMDDEKSFVTVSSDNSARVWEVATGKELATMENSQNAFASVSVLAQSHRILTLDSEEPATERGVATVVDAESGKIVSRIALPSQSQGVPADITSITFSRAGDRVLVNGGSGSPTIFDLPDGKTVMSVPTESFGVQAVLSPNGRQLALKTSLLNSDGQSHSRIDISEVSGNALRSIPLADEIEGDLGFSPDGKFVTLGQRRWSAETVEEWSLAGNGIEPDFSYSPRGKLLASVSKTAVPDDPLQNAAAIWNPRTGTVNAMLRGDTGPVATMAISPDGKLAAVAFDDGSIKLWDPSTGRQIGIIDHLKGSTGEDLPGVHIRCLAFAPDGNRLVLADDSDMLHVWNVPERTETASVAGPSNTRLIRFSPDGRFLAASGNSDDNAFRLWDAASLKALPAPDWRSAYSYNLPFAFSPDGRYLVGTSAGDQAFVFETATGKIVGTLRGHSSRVTGVAYSPNGERIATVSGDDKIHLWDSATFAETVIPTGYGPGINDVVFSADGRTLAVASEHNAIGIWDIERGSQLLKLSGHTAAVKKIFFVDRGALLVSLSEDRTLRSWKTDTGQEVARFAYRAEISDAIAAENIVISAGSQLGDAEEPLQLAVWDTNERRKLKIQHEQRGKFSLAFSPEENYLLILPELAAKDKSVVLWDIPTEKVIGELKSTDDVGRSAVFSPDGRLVVTYGWNDSAQVWRTADASLQGVLVGSQFKDLSELLNGRSMNRAEFVFGGHRILTHSSNGLLRLWDTASLQLLATFMVGGESYQTALDGRRLIFSGSDGSVRFWRIAGTTQELVDLACELLPAPLTTIERKEYFLDPEPEHYPCGLKPQ